MDPAVARARRARRLLISLTTAFLCGLALAACGSDGDSGASNEDQVREVAEQLTGNDPAACSKLTKDFLKELGGKEECEKSAEVEEDKKPVVEDVKVDGDTATAVVIDEDRSTLKFVKEGDEWLASGVEAVEKGAGKAGSDEAESSPEEPEPTPDASGGGDETDARAAVEAFLMGAQDKDSAVLCGLFSERLAKQLTGAKEFGIAECLSAFKAKPSLLDKLAKGLAGVTVKDIVILRKGKLAGVIISNGAQIKLKYQDGRFVIDEL